MGALIKSSVDCFQRFVFIVWSCARSSNYFLCCWFWIVHTMEILFCWTRQRVFLVWLISRHGAGKNVVARIFLILASRVVKWWHFLCDSSGNLLDAWLLFPINVKHDGGITWWSNPTTAGQSRYKSATNQVPTNSPLASLLAAVKQPACFKSKLESWPPIIDC